MAMAKKNEIDYEFWADWYDHHANGFQRNAAAILLSVNGYRNAVDYALTCLRPDPPKTEVEFIERYPQYPGMSVYACTLLLRSAGITYALGETSLWVWYQVRYRQAEVIAVLYAGNDRNKAIRIAEMYNRCA
jgi:hypothetical protein